MQMPVRLWRCEISFLVCAVVNFTGFYFDFVLGKKGFVCVEFFVLW